MQVVLVMFRSDGERRSFSVVRNMTVIGRREDCDLRIPVGDVSRKHCRLVRTDDGIRIEDLGSSNGTHVNGMRVQESDLNAGDVVGIGPVQFIVQIDGVPDEDEMNAPVAAPAHDESSMMGQPIAPDELVPDDAVLEEAVAAEEYHVEAEPANNEPTIDENELVIEDAPVDEEPLEEAVLEEAPLDEVVLDEVELEEEPAELEEIKAEESPLTEEETPLEEIPADAVADETEAAPAPVEEIAEDELGLEEFPIEEMETPAAETPVEIEPIEHTPVAEAPAEPSPIAEDELQLEEPATEPLSLDDHLNGLEMLDELEPIAPPAPPTPAAEHLDSESLLPTTPVEEIVPVNLEEEDTNAETEPAGVKSADDSEWDFVIEESDGERSNHDFKIDLDTPHQQPRQ